MTFTYHGRRPRIMLENPWAAHEIRIASGPPGNSLIVGCVCGAVLHIATLVTADWALTLWKEHEQKAKA